MDDIMDLTFEKPDPALDPINGIAQDWCEEYGLGRLPSRVARTVFETQDPRIPCENCGIYDGVEPENGRTAYHWDGSWDDPENPNRNLWLCRHCAMEHHENWDGMWAEYYQSRW